MFFYVFLSSLLFVTIFKFSGLFIETKLLNLLPTRVKVVKTIEAVLVSDRSNLTILWLLIG